MLLLLTSSVGKAGILIVSLLNVRPLLPQSGRVIAMYRRLGGAPFERLSATCQIGIIMT
jgi:hypothetical protein